MSGCIDLREKREKIQGCHRGFTPCSPRGRLGLYKADPRLTLKKKQPYNLNFHLFFRGNEQDGYLYKILRVEATYLFYVPRVLEDLPCFVGELVSAGSENFGDDEGSFPGGVSL